MVMAITGMAAALAAPMVGNMVANFRINGDIRGISTGTNMAKMRAAAMFTSARFYVDLSARTYRVQTWRKTGTPGWQNDGATQPLSSGVTFGFGAVSAAPPNTQGTLGQAAPCREDDNVTLIADTACVLFNSRGLPVDAVGSPDGSGAYYLRDSYTVYAVTVSATGMVRVWRSPLSATPAWSLQ